MLFSLQIKVMKTVQIPHLLAFDRKPILAPVNACFLSATQGFKNHFLSEIFSRFFGTFMYMRHVLIHRKEKNVISLLESGLFNITTSAPKVLLYQILKIAVNVHNSVMMFTDHFVMMNVVAKRWISRGSFKLIQFFYQHQFNKSFRFHKGLMF